MKGESGMSGDEKDDLLKIDLARLEENCAEQTTLMRQWGDMLALARKKVTDTDNALKVTRAELRKKITQKPDAYGLVKDRVDDIEGAIIVHAEYRKGVEAVTQAEYEKDLIKSMVDALNDRRTDLENLVLLHGQMYFAKPNTSGEPKKPKIDPTKSVGRVDRK